jgi:hypothetical protein
MNRSLSPIDVNERSASLEEQLHPVRGRDIQAILPADFRNRDPKWLLVDEGFTLPASTKSSRYLRLPTVTSGTAGRWQRVALCQRPPPS